jgi:hypothetical protein
VKKETKQNSNPKTPWTGAELAKVTKLKICHDVNAILCKHVSALGQRNYEQR